MESPDSGPASGGQVGNKIGVRFYRYRAILKKYWWIVAICMAVALGYEAWQVLSKPTRYISVGKMSVRENSTDERSLTNRSDPSWYGTIIKTIESPAVHQAAKKLVRDERPGQEGKADGVTTTAMNEVNTFFFAITCVGPDPEFTAYFTDCTMKAFKKSREDESRSDMAAQLEEKKQQLGRDEGLRNAAQTELSDFMQKENVTFIEEKKAQLTSDNADLRHSFDGLQEELNIMEHMDEGAVLKSQGGTNPTAPGAKRGNDTDSSGEMLSDKEVQLGQKEEELRKRAEVWKPAHPGYRSLVDEIDNLKVAIAVLKAKGEKGRAAGVARLKVEIENKRQRITANDEATKQFAIVLGQYSVLRDKFNRQDELYKETRKQLDELMRKPTSKDILTIQQEASAPVEESRGIFKGLLTGVFGGLILGLAILFVLDRADDRLASSSEMIEQFNEPILGQIPDVADSRTNEGLPLLQTEDDRYMYAEAFRSLRSSLIFMPNQTELKSLIITSAIPNEGKSTIASNLAITMANAGARVLLVDADLRRGDIAALFDTDGRQGLANILRGEVEWKDCIKSMRNDKLHIIPRGPVTNQSGELLLQPSLPKLLAEWKAGYDLVIFNTAPILATDDTPTVAPNFDGTLMVIRASFTSARLTRNALNALYQRQVNVLGLILNCVDTEMPDYYYYRYPKYYAA